MGLGTVSTGPQCEDSELLRGSAGLTHRCWLCICCERSRSAAAETAGNRTCRLWGDVVSLKSYTLQYSRVPHHKPLHSPQYAACRPQLIWAAAPSQCPQVSARSIRCLLTLSRTGLTVHTRWEVRGAAGAASTSFTPLSTFASWHTRPSLLSRGFATVLHLVV